MNLQRLALSATLASPGFAVAWLAAAPFAAAGTLTLTDGERVHGTLAGAQDGQIQIETMRFGARWIDLDSMVGFETVAPVMIELDTGERLVADGLKADSADVLLRTRFGEISVTWDEIISIEEQPDPLGASVDNVDAVGGVGNIARKALATTSDDESFSRNSLSTTVGFVGNQTSTLFGGQRNQFTSASTTYTYNLTTTAAISMEVPYSYSVARVTDFGEETRETTTGVGDVSITGSQVFPGADGWPSVRAAVNVGLPTGETGGPADRALSGFSSGDWSLGADVMIQQPLPGGALVGGAGYTYFWPRSQDGTASAEADQVEWTVGYAVGLGPQLSLTTSVSGSVFKRNTMQSEPAYFMLAASYVLDNGLTITPTYANGLNIDAQDFMVALNVSRSW